jgi:RHS repeat-associated protein
VEEPGTLASFAYAFGRRLAKTVNGTGTQFLYDGLDIAQQFEAQQVTSYLRSLAIDETLGLTTPDGSFSLITDALGSTVAVSDASGSAVTQYTYDTFGAVSATNPAFPNPFQFTGRENDGLVGLYYYRARYYDSSAMRFLSEDPLRGQEEINLCAYVKNNPLRFVDPSGLQREPYVYYYYGPYEDPCKSGDGCYGYLKKEDLQRASTIITSIVRSVVYAVRLMRAPFLKPPMPPQIQLGPQPVEAAEPGLLKQSFVPPVEPLASGVPEPIPLSGRKR